LGVKKKKEEDGREGGREGGRKKGRKNVDQVLGDLDK
jgi:hypothetical protein